MAFCAPSALQIMGACFAYRLSRASGKKQGAQIRISRVVRRQESLELLWPEVAYLRAAPSLLSLAFFAARALRLEERLPGTPPCATGCGPKLGAGGVHMSVASQQRAG